MDERRVVQFPGFDRPQKLIEARGGGEQPLVRQCHPLTPVVGRALVEPTKSVAPIGDALSDSSHPARTKDSVHALDLRVAREIGDGSGGELASKADLIVLQERANRAERRLDVRLVGSRASRSLDHLLSLHSSPVPALAAPECIHAAMLAGFRGGRAAWSGWKVGTGGRSLATSVGTVGWNGSTADRAVSVFDPVVASFVPPVSPSDPAVPDVDLIVAAADPFVSALDLPVAALGSVLSDVDPASRSPSRSSRSFRRPSRVSSRSVRRLRRRPARDHDRERRLRHDRPVPPGANLAPDGGGGLSESSRSARSMASSSDLAPMVVRGVFGAET